MPDLQVYPRKIPAYAWGGRGGGGDRHCQNRLMHNLKQIILDSVKSK